MLDQHTHQVDDRSMHAGAPDRPVQRASLWRFVAVAILTAAVVGMLVDAPGSRLLLAIAIPLVAGAAVTTAGVFR